MKMIGVNFPLNWCILAFLWDVSCIVFDPNIHHMISVFGIGLHDKFVSDFVLIPSVLLSLVFIYDFGNISNFAS